MHWASYNGHAAVVQTLLQHGADVAATDKVGAAGRGRSCRCGPAADRTPALQDGETSLHKASGGGHAAVVQTLLQHGADVAATNKVGAAGVPRASAWGCARECLHAMCVRAIVCMDLCVADLIKEGADVNEKDHVS